MHHRSIITTALLLFAVAAGAQHYTGANECRIRIDTDTKDYEFRSDKLEARLNDALERLEFIIPVTSVFTLNDSTDAAFLNSIVDDHPFIMINAPMPQDRIDFSSFKGGNTAITLSAEIKIGPYTFNNSIQLKGMLANDNNTIIFDLRASFDNGEKPLIRLGNENITAIEIAALGDKISGLTSN